MKPRRVAALIVVVAIVGSLAPAAAARTGWLDRKTQRAVRYTDVNTIRRCGTKLGTYSFSRQRTFTSGVNVGKILLLRTTIALVADGNFHHFQFVSLGGSYWRGLNLTQRQRLRDSVKADLAPQAVKVVKVVANRLFFRDERSTLRYYQLQRITC